MQVIPNKGILVNQCDGTPCRSGCHNYWDSQFSGIVQQYLGSFCPSVNVVNTPTSVSDAFTVEFHKDEAGRELCGKSDSFSNPKAQVQLSDVATFVDALDAMHKKSEDPAISPDAREFIRSFRIPNPLVMKDSWRVLCGSRKLSLLWGYAGSYSSDSTILPLTETSRKWADAGQRIDVREVLNNSGRIGTGNTNLCRALIPIFAILGGGALLFAYVNSNHHDRKFSYNGGSGDAVRYVDPNPVEPVPDVFVPDPSSPHPKEEILPDTPIFDPPRPVEPQKRMDEPTPNKPGKVTPKSGVARPSWPKGKCCDIHPARLINGTCPVACKIHNIHLDKDMRCPRCEGSQMQKMGENQLRPDAADKEDDRGSSKSTLGGRERESCCDIHKDKILVNGACPVRCQVCGSHLDDDGGTRCPATCSVHKGVHKVNGVCPKCETPITVENAWIVEESTKEQGGLCYPTLRIMTMKAVPANAKVRWIVDGKESGANGERFTPEKGFDPKSTHQIMAMYEFMKSGRICQIKTGVYAWTKGPVDAKAVERHIGLCGKKTDEKGYDCFVLRLFSNPEDNNAKVEEWVVELDGRGIKTQEDGVNAIRIYKSQIPKDGKVKVVANTKIGTDTRREFTASFAFKADILSADESFGDQSVNRAHAIKEIVGGSVVLCCSDSGSGTAFAVSECDLITNHHVVEGDADGRLVLIKEGWQAPVSARVVKVNKDADLAWIRAEKSMFAPLAIIGNMDYREGTEVASFGYPYCAVKDVNQVVPEMSTSLGTIKGQKNNLIWHTAEIYCGNSGGPLVDMRGVVVGVNVMYIATQQGGEVYNKRDLAIPAGRIVQCFPDLRVNKDR